MAAESLKQAEDETSFITSSSQVVALDVAQDEGLESRSASGGSPEEGEGKVVKPAVENPQDGPSEPPTSESIETVVSSYRPRGSAQYQLVFGMDDESSETSMTSSPRSVESSTPFLPVYCSGDLLPKSSNPISQDEFGDLEVESHDSGITSQLGSVAPSKATDDSFLGDETLSMYSGSTLVAESLVSGTNEKLQSQKEEERRTMQHDGSSLGVTAEEVGPGPQRTDTQSPDSEGVQLDDVQLQPRSLSGSVTPPPKPKVHPLSVDTSDSDAAVTPPYSPVDNLLEDEEEEMGNVAILPPSPLPPGLDSLNLLDDQPVMSILFSGVVYLGSSSVDAPISETEANRKMSILKQQAAGSEPIPIILSIPITNDGNVILKDPESEQPMATFPVKMILFCARGHSEDFNDCLCLNVKHARSTGTYHCHVFKCDILEACQKIFEAIGRAFKTKPGDAPLSPTGSSELSCEFDVTVEIHEDDGKGNYNLVSTDKDCFKLRQNTRKKVVLSVTQPTSSTRPLAVERCFGLLISPGKDVKHSEMNLLDNMNCTSGDQTFTVAGYWDINVPFLTPLNEETPKSVRHQYLTIAADLVLECVTEPVRFKRELKVRVSKGDMFGFLQSKRKHPTETYILTLQKCDDCSSKKVLYSVVGLTNARELKDPKGGMGGPPQQLPQGSSPSVSSSPISLTEGQDARPQLISAEEAAHSSPSQRKKPPGASGGGITAKSQLAKVKEGEHEVDSDVVDEGDDDVLPSGWGQVDDMREDLFKDWREMLDKWDGKEKSRPKQLVKLCRKGIPRDLRCQVWQLLCGAAYDPQLYEAYRLLLSKDSPSESVISWDIKRTYVGHNYFQEGEAKEALYKICMAYSVYDEEVGYCQGFSFMAAVLLLQKMPEEQAFSVLVKVMYNYGHRDVFKDNFHNLHLMFFQLGQLLEENMPDLSQHFLSHGVETHMYASQWFLTVYTAKFPLSIVFRIFDIYLCERSAVVFRVALGLLKVARKELLGLDFEGILNYFRVVLPRKFQSEEECQHLFHAMFTFKVTERKLKRLEKEHQSYLEQQAQLEDPVKRLERENKQLRDTLIRLEQENDNLAQELVTSKVTLRVEMDRLEERIDTLSKECRAKKTTADAAQLQISELREELQQAKEEYQKVMIRLMEERQQHEGAITEYKQLFQQLDEGHQKQKEELNQELLEVKAKLGSVSSGEMEANSSQQLSSLSSEQRLRDLELELAQTKLALVESQCKNQELEHKVEELHLGQSNVLKRLISKKK